LAALPLADNERTIKSGAVRAYFDWVRTWFGVKIRMEIDQKLTCKLNFGRLVWVCTSNLTWKLIVDGF
jgi:hypothetical protein